MRVRTPSYRSFTLPIPNHPIRARRTGVIGTLAAALLFVVIGMDAPATAGPKAPVEQAQKAFEDDTANRSPVAGAEVSMWPAVTVRYGHEDQRERLDLALVRFRDAGLLLPDLEVIEVRLACELIPENLR